MFEVVKRQQWWLSVENIFSATLPFNNTFEAPQMSFKRKEDV